ncbi:putative endonuclease lcl3 [Coniothyrium glycines]
MRWPWSSKEDHGESIRVPGISTSAHSNDRNEWRGAYTEPRTLIPAVGFTLSTLVAVRLYKSYLRRIPTVNHIKPSYFRRRSLFGRVTSVGDADNFRLYHTPGGRLAGWEWLPWKRIPTKREGVMKQTLHIRIAGVDAPELAHWGREAQPFSKEAFDYLTNLILNQRVRVHLYRRDQYDRIVARVYVRKWLRRKDVGLEMLKLGLATVYEARTGAEFGDAEAQYRAAEEAAKEGKIGMWAQPSLLQKLSGSSVTPLESPREYKSRHAMADKQKKVG